MSLLDQQKLDTGNNSEANQAGRDIIKTTINQNGLSYSDIKDIFNDLFELNFHRIREDAKEIAKINHNKFLESFEKVFKEKIEKIDTGKLKEPNFQNNLSETIKSTSIRGDKSNLDLISEILAISIEKNVGDKIELIASEALTVAPKLSRHQLAFLSILFLINHCNLSLQSIEEIADAYLPILNKLLIEMVGLTSTDREALIYFRAYSFSSLIYTTNVFKGLGDNYSIFQGREPDEYRMIFENYSPEFSNAMNSLEIHEFNHYTLSPIGKLLGLQFLAQIHTVKFELKSWIN